MDEVNHPADDPAPGRPPGAPEDVDYGALDGLLGYALRRAQLRLYEDFARAMEDSGLTPQLFAALVLVRRNPGLSQTRLGEALGIARSGAMTVTDRLQALGLVERRAVDGDRRRHGLHLTAKGRRALPRLLERVRAHDARIARALDDDERATLRTLLDRIAPGG